MTSTQTTSIKTTFWLFVVISLLLLLFGLYLFADHRISVAHEQFRHSSQLADELRQSSDDLTRMVRTYVVTREPRYKANFQEILDIRDGKKPRPSRLDAIYWDLVLGDNERPYPAGDPVALLSLMKQAGFTEKEFQLLELGKIASDKLTEIEFAAMQMIEQDDLTRQAHFKAINLVHDAAYHQYKKEIMSPIAEFQALVQARTLANINDAERFASVIMVMVTVLGVIGFWLLIGMLKHNRNEATVLENLVKERTEELRMSRDEAESANRAKSDFISTISHELKTPLNSVIGFTGLLETDTDIPASSKDSVIEIKTASENLNNMVEGIIEYAGLDLQDKSKKFHEITIEPLLNQTRSKFLSEIESMQLDLTIEVEPELVAWGDTQMLHTVFAKILSNAVKFNQLNGKIIIKAVGQGDSVQIRFTDTGVGIAEDKLEMVFEPLNRLGAENSAVGGIGIGLSTAKRLMEIMHGTIHVSSAAGTGTSVTLEIPALADKH